MATRRGNDIGRRQRLFLSWMVRQEADGGQTFQTPWGPVEDDRVRRSLAARGLLTPIVRSTASGNIEVFSLTAAGREIGQQEWVKLRNEWPNQSLVFPWEADYPGNPKFQVTNR